jgi:MFS-type transporter involved in bile tolerance (Atg22 family)
VLFVFARIGFTAANVFYDALLPHVAKAEDQDRVSTRGYAMGYLGGGLLLAINIAMIEFLPGTLGPRLSFLSVALWWGLFSIPLFLRIPEPPSLTAELDAYRSRLARTRAVVKTSFDRLRGTFKDLRQYRDLFRFLIAFLIYNDGIGTIIGVAAIYGAELGFGSVELILALLLVQFIGIPFSLIFGRLPTTKEKRRSFFLAFIIFNLTVLPIAGLIAKQVLPADTIGSIPAPYRARETFVGEGSYSIAHPQFSLSSEWERISFSPPSQDAVEYATTSQDGASLTLPFIGQETEVTFWIGPDAGIWSVEIDGKPLLDEDTLRPREIDSYQSTVRFGVTETFAAEQPGEHVITLINTGRANVSSAGTLISFSQVRVLPPTRSSNLMLILGMLVVIEIVGLGISALLAGPVFSRVVGLINTKRSILLTLVAFAVISIWGYFLNSVVEFWFLAWMIAVVLGGSQALSRSLYSSMTPAAKSGEFFGMFGVMEKFSAILGPLIFAAAVATFGSSRPAILSLVVFFILGSFLLSKVDVAEGRRVAIEENEALRGV